MKINPNSFNIVQDQQAIIAPGTLIATEQRNGPCPILFYPMNIYNTSTSAWVDYDVPAGSRIILSIKQWRNGTGSNCEERRNTLEKTIVSANSYDNMYDWFVGENIEQFLDDGVRYAGGGDCIPENVFVPVITNTPNDFSPNSPSLCTNYYRFYRDSATNALSLMVTGTFPCSGTNWGKRVDKE